MRMFVAALLLMSGSAFAEVSTNANGKTLNQFLYMASDYFNKPVVASPDIEGELILFGVNETKNFSALFYSLLRAHGLSAINTELYIRVQKASKGLGTVDGMSALHEYITAQVKTVYITGSVGRRINGVTDYDYVFSDGKDKTFHPDALGLTVYSMSECSAMLGYKNYKTIVTCQPYTEIKKPEKRPMKPAPVLPVTTEKKNGKELLSKKSVGSGA
ncbi:hypothetical protein CS022_04550 [Veronia nyctiphanis]|uniref:Uncharacterized protein n=1 Tax=Veronia nyctiphanis TaxID=1278244 RepID=A0A4Q0YU83_9GAMM|nr:hypothetical protein [Veronia nyctiphanis]RXJ74325.1 hypothetical protein CS022_04550 [Veronia nyctiphanis]